ncbi:MAG: OmpA family protein [Candidatus Omnitrophota bacterium]|jgi:outer membrane protein OmpA-like peptidoglycan-associated protein
MKRILPVSKTITYILALGMTALFFSGCALDRESKRKAELESMQKQFNWWPTDAKPAPVKDENRQGYWWWPKQAGTVKEGWGNRGYCYLYKVIFDYKEEELPPPQPQEMRPSLLIKKIIKNVKVYFNYNKDTVREDAASILEEAVRTLTRNPQADILITGNCDIRGSENYNEKLGRKRAESVKQFMLDKGVAESRIRIVSRGKLDAVAPVSDLVGMQKDRNAQFMVAEVEEVMIPYGENIPQSAQSVEENKYVEEAEQQVESEVKVSTKEYIVQSNDSLWKIAEKELGNGRRWKNIYELNREKIKNPNKLKKGITLVIPIE